MGNQLMQVTLLHLIDFVVDEMPEKIESLKLDKILQGWVILGQKVFGQEAMLIVVREK